MVSEVEMIKRTIIRNTEIFQKYFGNIEIEEITKLVSSSSPDRLEELLYVAKFDINIAKEIVRQRNYNIFSSEIGENIP